MNELAGILKNFSFVSLLKNGFDVLLISYILYQAVMLLRGTRAIQVFKGFILLIIVTAVARLLGLRTLIWILEIFWNVWLLATVIIFQPELRKAFAEMGKRHSSDLMSMEDTLNEVVDSVLEMSTTKTGALIAIERNTGLKEFVNTGVKLDAAITKELLNSIFFKNSPLHDGGIVLQHNQVAAAACFFPLTEKEGLPKNYGARHRAAVGLSEVSDAIIILVSEETGSIEVVIEQEMKTLSTKGEIFGFLYENLRKKTGLFEAFHRPEEIKKNLYLKLLSFLLAAVLWYVVRRIKGI